jgi:subtilase family serine protease
MHIDARLWSTHPVLLNREQGEIEMKSHVGRWRLTGPAPLDYEHSVILAIRPNKTGTQRLVELFESIHDPSSPSWLEHLSSPSQLDQITAQPQHVIGSIYSWLTQSGVSKSNIHYKPGADAIQFKSSVKILNAVFNTTMHTWQFHSQSNGPSNIHALTHGEQAHLPDHLMDYIDFADGLHFMPTITMSNVRKSISSEGATSDASTSVNPSDPSYDMGHSTRRKKARSFHSMSQASPRGWWTSWTDEDTVFAQSCLNDFYYQNTNLTMELFNFGDRSNPNYTGNVSMAVIQFWTVDSSTGNAVAHNFNQSDLTLFTKLWTDSTVAGPLKIDHAFGVNDSMPGTWIGNAAVIGMSSMYPPASANYELQPSPTTTLYQWCVDFNSRANVPQVISLTLSAPEGAFVMANDRSSVIEGQLASIYLDRINIELMKMGLRGVTVLASSGDDGANGSGNLQCDYSADHSRFQPEFPSSSPYVTSVGSTSMSNWYYDDFIPGGQLCGGAGPWDIPGMHHYPRSPYRWFFCLDARRNRERAMNECAPNWADPRDGFSSGGGFSQYFAAPSYQNRSVSEWSSLPSSLTLTNSSSMGNLSAFFNRSNRAIPDISMWGKQMPVVLDAWYNTVSGGVVSVSYLAGIVAQLNDFLITQNGIPRTLGFLNPLLYSDSVRAARALIDVPLDRNSGHNQCPNDFNSTSQCRLPNHSCQGFNVVDGWDPVTGLGTPNYYALQQVLGQLIANNTIGNFSGNQTGSVTGIGPHTSTGSNMAFSLFSGMSTQVFVVVLVFIVL